MPPPVDVVMMRAVILYALKSNAQEVVFDLALIDPLTDVQGDRLRDYEPVAVARSATHGGMLAFWRRNGWWVIGNGSMNGEYDARAVWRAAVPGVCINVI